jgi:glycosyltransferase involved in cell wall biosynthesis
MNEMKNAPKVSVVIPTYNRGDLIGETIRSLQEQEFEDFEVIIVDDGSTDNTKILCEEVISADSRFAYVAEDKKNRGPSYCRNKGYRMAQGEYLIFLDSDDLFLPGALKNRVELMDARKDKDFIVFIGEFFKRRVGDTEMLWNIPTDVDPLIRFIGDDTPWQTTGPTWRTSSFEKTGLWDEGIVGCDDQEFHTRALMGGLRYEFIGEVDYALRGAVDGRDQLGQVLSKRRGIMSQVSRIKNICEGELNLEGQKLKTAKKMMAGSLLSRSVAMLEYHNDKAAAVQIWEIVYKHHLLSLRTYLIGCLWIKNYKSFFGDIAAYLIYHLESDDFLLKNRALLATTPTSCLEEEPYDGRFHRQDSFVMSRAVRKGLLTYMLEKMRIK